MENKKGFKYWLHKISKILSWCAMAILCIIGAFLITYVVINKVAQAKGETSKLGLYTIISPSMTPDIKVYDVVFVVKTDPSEIEIGDIISYYSTNSYFDGIPITHRVIEKHSTTMGYTFRTKGDANPVADDEVIMSNNVVGVVKFVIPQLGRIQFFLASKAGWLIVILIPALGIIIYDILKLVKLVKVKNKMTELENNKSKENESRKEIEENDNLKEDNDKNDELDTENNDEHSSRDNEKIDDSILNQNDKE